MSNAIEIESRRTLSDRIVKKGSRAYILICTLVGIGLMSGCGTLQRVAGAAPNLTDAIGMSFATPGRQIEAKVTNMEFIENGKSFTIDILLTNRGEDIETYMLDARGESMAVDNLGTQGRITIAFGKNSGFEWCSSSLPRNTPVKATFTVSGFSSRATALSLVRVNASCGYAKCPGATGDFILRNIPLR
ncbi:MAG: hypothetical protein LBJ72_02610 [Dysgonamonadaceae bacterium]|jgi:hypothetical protein|nr:hypothetical protein [Dysgonamonadaceae bacterium]